MTTHTPDQIKALTEALQHWAGDKIKIAGVPYYQDSTYETWYDYYWPSNDERPTYAAAVADTPHRIISHVDPKRRTVMVQAGGNAGYFVRIFADKFKRVYTFEPGPVNFMCLAMNTFANGNVVKFQACVGNRHELVTLNSLHDDDTGGKHVDYGHPSELSTPTYTGVPTMMIDDLALDDCGLIQLDIEGYELFALKGAEKTIDRFKPVLAVEVSGEWLNRYFPNKDGQKQLEDWLFSKGYEEVDRFETDRVYKAKQ